MMELLSQEIEKVRESFNAEVGKIQSASDLRVTRETYFSRKRGLVTGLYNRLKEVPGADKPGLGMEINRLRVFIETALQQAEATQLQDGKNRIDYSLPPSDMPVGRLHPLTFVRREIESIFIQMGYEVAAGPEIETEVNNFDALNVPLNHPARDEHDTFFIADHDGMILRTHTSPVQIRYMQSHPPPIQIIAPGKTFRKDNPDATHTPVFQQVEGLLVDKGIHFSHLKGTLEHFLRLFFGESIRMMFRPTFFPFTEPSADVYISCFLCEGKNDSCPICKGRGWLEVLGSGMVHPQVLRNCGINPDIYSGFAFGMGIERMTIVKYGVPDLRMLYDNDFRLIEQLG